MPPSLLARLMSWVRPASPDAVGRTGAASHLAPVDDGDVEAPRAPWLDAPASPAEPMVPRPGGSHRSRLCLTRAQIHEARQRQPGAVPGPPPRVLKCPDRGELITLGFFTPTPVPSMSGTHLESGPFRDDRCRCCYELLHWSTGRPLRVAGELRAATLAIRPGSAWR